jgi:threonine dehydrogenase-like Zn-dependent dehydrogenase
MSKAIKAAVLTRPGHIEIQEFPRPRLEKGALLLRMEMCGICGTDKHTYRGESRQYAGTSAESNTPFPIIQGHENVGIVEEINGEFYDFDHQLLKPGDRITMCPDYVCGHCWYCRNTFGYPWCENVRGYGNAFTSAEPPHLFGGYAEYMYILPGTFVYKVPESLPVEVAVLTELFTVSYAVDACKEVYSLSGFGFTTGCTVVVHGVGPMGLFFLIRARMMGAGEIIAIDRSAYRLEMAKQFGADLTLNTLETSSEERIAFVRDRTQGRGADLGLECAGVPEAVVEGLEMLRKGGTYVEAGNFADTGDIAFNPHRLLCAKNVRLIGVTNHPYTGYGPCMRLMERHAKDFPFERIVTHRYPVEQAEEALLKSMQPDSMKVVLVP